jgi:hypothetical protein
MENDMLRKILIYGVIAGAIVGVPVFGMAFALKNDPAPSWGLVVGYLTMLIALSAVFVAVKRYRDEELGGVIRFWPALALGLGISFVASVCYVVAWEAGLAFTGMDFAGEYSRVLIEQQRAKGVSGEALARFVAEMEEFKVQYANPLFRLPMTFVEIFPVGVLVSLLAAGLLRNSRFLPARRASAA